jgi:hypothetical protein
MNTFKLLLCYCAKPKKHAHALLVGDTLGRALFYERGRHSSNERPSQSRRNGSAAAAVEKMMATGEKKRLTKETVFSVAVSSIETTLN